MITEFLFENGKPASSGQPSIAYTNLLDKKEQTPCSGHRVSSCTWSAPWASNQSQRSGRS